MSQNRVKVLQNRTEVRLHGGWHRLIPAQTSSFLFPWQGMVNAHSNPRGSYCPCATLQRIFLVMASRIALSRSPSRSMSSCTRAPPTLPPVLTRFCRTSDGDLIRGPEQGFVLVHFLWWLFFSWSKIFSSHSLNIHFPITRSSMTFLKKKVMLLS